jgi:hypothetical protein
MTFAYRLSCCYLSFDFSSQIQPRVDVVVDCEKKGEDQLFQAVDDTEADNADNDEDNDEDNDDNANDDEAANGTLASNSWQLPLGTVGRKIGTHS